MGMAVIPAAIQSSLSHSHSRSQSQSQAESQHLIQHPQSSRDTSHSPSHDLGSSGLTIRNVSYGSTATSSGSPNSLIGVEHSNGSGKGKEPELDDHDASSDEDGQDEEEDEDEDEEQDPIIDVTWRYMSRLYSLVPIITLVWLALLILLVTFAWPPSERERQAGQRYPHPFLFKPFAIGIFASCTVQTIRVPTWEVVSWLISSSSLVTFLSTTLHAIIHELLRLSTIPLIVPSPTSGFHSTFYLGLGWGVAEVTWGMVQGWEQLALYQELMKRPEPLTPDLEFQFESQNLVEDGRKGETGLGLSAVIERSEEDEEQDGVIEDDEDGDEGDEDEAELERKVELLERMRARRDLEQVIGLPFPNIPFPLHLLWRLDTLLLNLGLTLLLAAFYYNPTPIYRHRYIVDSASTTWTMHDTPARTPDTEPSKYLWLVWVLVALVHVVISLVWKVVGRVGVGAVTWGGLIVALGSVFAGLGSWGGLV